MEDKNTLKTNNQNIVTALSKRYNRQIFQKKVIDEIVNYCGTEYGSQYISEQIHQAMMQEFIANNDEPATIEQAKKIKEDVYFSQNPLQMPVGMNSAIYEEINDSSIIEEVELVC